MAVLAEAFSVIIKKDSLKRNKRHYKQFIRNIADKKTVCDDGVIVRVGFMLYDDAINYLKYLRHGLELSSHTSNNKAGDFVLVDMLNGTMVECDWLEFLRDKLFVEQSEFQNSNEDFSIVWHKDDYSGNSCSQAEGFSAEGICFPKLWTPDNAIYTDDLIKNSDEEEIINQENGVKTIRNKLTDKITYQGRAEQVDNEENNKFDDKIISLYIEADKYYTGEGAELDREKAESIYEEIIDFGIKMYGESYADKFANDVFFVFGDGVKGSRDYERCRILYNMAGSKNSALANNSLGHMYYFGKGVKEDLFYGIYYFKLASSLGYAKSSFILSQIYSSEKGVIYDIDKAIEYCDLALKGNHEEAFHEYSRLMSLQESESKSYLFNKSINDFLHNSNADSKVFYELAESYVYGISNDIDLDKAEQCYTEILKLELLKDDKVKVLVRFHEYVLKNYHSNSRGDLEFIIADRLYKLLCDFGNLDAYYTRSTLYFFGTGVERDIAKAISLLEEGRDKGDEECALALIKIFSSDKHNLYNINRAIIHCNIAIERGFPHVKTELLPLKIQKENSGFEDVTSLFYDIDNLIKENDVRVINTLNEIFTIAQRDYFKDDFILEFYSSFKGRLKNNNSENKFHIDHHIDVLSFFADKDCNEAINDLGTILFYTSKRTGDKVKAIELWEQASVDSFVKSTRNLLKVLKTDEFGTKDIEKYHYYKRVLNRIENPKPYARPEIKNPNRLFKAISRILGWIEE